MPFVEGGIVEDVVQQQSPSVGGFVEGGIVEDPTPEDSYNRVLQFEAAQTDYIPSKQEFLDYYKVSKTKPLLGETPLATMGEAAVQTAKDIAMLPYRAGEAISQYIEPPEGVTPMQVAGGTAAEIAVQSKLKAQRMGMGLLDTALNKLSDLTGKLRNDDDKYEAFLAAAEIKRQLARANAPEEQRVPAAQEVLQAYGIPQEAISQPGLEVGGFAADPSSIAFAGGGRLASMALQRGVAQIPRISAALQRGGEGVSAAARMPEEMLGRATTAVTGSGRMGEAVQGAVSTGSTGIALGEAAGLPISGTLNVPVVGTASRIIGGTKALGATLETVGEAGTVSGGPALTAIQRGLLGAGERIAAAEGASAAARALGTAVARSGLEAPIKGAATILLPMVGAGAAGGLLAAISGEEADAISAAIGSGAAFGAFDGGFKLAKSVEANVFNGARVRQTAVDDLNTRPTEVQFTYVDPVNGEQTVTIKDADARATLYGRLNNKQLTKALSEVAGAEGAGIEVIFHTDADTVPGALQTVNYAGVSIGPENVKSGKPTVLINVDKASPETLPHEILHARITQAIKDMLGGKVIDTSSQDPDFKRQFTDFANAYADKLESRGGRVIADRIRTELRDAFDPAQQRAQQIASLNRITDEFAAYYTQEFLKGKDPKTMLPGRIPSFIELALNNAKEAVSERFTRRALQAGFDPVARTFYDANGRRIKLDWMEDAIKNLVNPKEGYEPTEQKVDTSKMTKAQQNAVIMARGYSDLFMTAPDGSIIRPLSKAELAAKTADVANRTMRVVESVPQAERTSVSGMDAKGNPVIEGRLSLREADALSQSGIFSPSTSRYIIDIATAIRDGTLMEGKYWKVFGSTGKSGVFGEADKLFLPYGVSINSKGGVNVKVVDWGKVQARMYKALTKPTYKNLFRNYDQAMSTLKDVYLKNIAEQNAVPSADALGGGLEGAKKRNFFNEVMGAVPRQGDVMSNLPTAGYVANRKGGSVYQDLRIERIQNAQSTGSNIPWSGDMGEQSSYRRTQLNFQPAETIGETTVSTDQNAGYRILSKNGKFRLYGPDGSPSGIFDTQEQAKLKAEKDYATQARLQPEVDQQQRVPGDEGRQTAEAGRGNRALGGAEGGQEGRQADRTVRQAGDVSTRFMPDQQGFYSKLEEVVTSKLPKVASSQQVLASVDPAKGSGVKPEELKWTGFAQAVERIAKENGGKVPKDQLMQHLKSEGAVRFEEVTTEVKGKTITQEEVDRLERRAQRTQSNADWAAYEDAVLRFESQELGTEAQYSRYQLPGGENYREVVLTSDTAKPYTSSHFKNIDNYVAHSRLNERVDNAGKPGLFIEEIQSDRHQAGRKGGYSEDQGVDWSKVPVYQYRDLVAKGEFPEVMHIDVAEGRYRLVAPDGAVLEVEGSLDKLKKKYDARTAKGTADAPFRKDWPLQMFKRALRDAVASGKDWVAWTDGQTQIDRYPELPDLGEGNKVFYDKILPTEIKKYVKQWGGDVEKSGFGKPTVSTDMAKFKAVSNDEAAQLAAEGKDLYVSQKAEFGETFNKIASVRGMSKQDIVSFLGSSMFRGGFYVPVEAQMFKYPMWRVDITPQMRKSVAETGQARFMPSDADYLSAVKKGDTAAAQRMVDEAAKAAGYDTRPYYHGTNADWTEYEDVGASTAGGRMLRRDVPGAAPIFVSSDPDVAESYGENVKKLFIDFGPSGKRAQIDAKGSTWRSVYDQVANAFNEGAQSVLVKNVVDSTFQADVLPSDVVSVLYPEQIKSADTITRDNKGNVIPLSQRFQSSSADIRFMPESIQRDIGRNQDFANPPTDTEAVDALSSEKKAKFGAARSIKPGTQVAARIDIPAFLRTGKYVVAVHEPDGAAGGPGKVIGYDTVTRLQNPKFVVKPGVQRIYEGKSAKFPVATVDGKIMADRSIPADLENYVPVGMDPKEHAYFYDKRTDQPVIGGSESVSVGNTVFVKNPVYGDPSQFAFMPSPDSAMPGAYSFPGGYRALPGKAKGSLRLYGPAGSLIGIAASLDEAQRIIRKKAKQ